MDIILGATGRVGSLLTETLLAKGRTVRAVVRNPAKAERLQRMGASVTTADFAEPATVRSAFAGGETAFIVTAEDPASADGVAEASAFLETCREAVQAAGIRRVVGLSSDGAQHASGTGFLIVSHRLEHVFDGMDAEKTFIRPSYYFSNWMLSLPLAREQGVLPTFFPADLAIPMIAPEDVAAYAAKVIAGETDPRPVHEITGPRSYSSSNIAQLLGGFLERDVKAIPIPEDQWLDTLKGVGFSPANARHMADMTAAVISGRAAAEGREIVLPTTFPDYARRRLAAEQQQG